MREDGSNSQNVKTIVSIRKTKGVVPAFLVEASDGSSFFCPQSLLSTQEWTMLLYVGNQIDEEQWTECEDQSEQVFAYLQCIRLLTRREHTRQELEQKLLLRRYSKASIQLALSKAESAGYINHERFAEQWLHQRVQSNPESMSRLQARLQSKGLDRTDAVLALQTYCRDHDVTEEWLCKRALDKIPQHVDQEKKMKKLQNLGFSYGIVSRVLENSEES